VAHVEANPAALVPGGGSVSATPQTADEGRFTEHHIGMISFLVSETAFFSTLIVAYIVFLGQSMTGPTPATALSLEVVIIPTLCLLSSSLTIHFADRALRHGQQATFLLFWGATITLGALFLAGTAFEWYGLIFRKGLTISRNMFGTTFYTLVGFHAAHVTVGVIVMLIVFSLAVRRRVTAQNRLGVELVSWYWHFVDGVWVVVFTLVYLVGR
jgi:cytochrome c oxidase subunit 3/cytochrome o ubiquinol oxidase subunit 3